MATITQYFRDVDKLTLFLDEITPQHSFFVYTSDSGDRYVLRGGQYQDMFKPNGTKYENTLNINRIKKGDLTVVHSKFEWNGTDENTKPIDWFSDHASTKASIYYTGSDIIASRLWNSMVLGGQNINNNPIAFKFFTDNCNTTLNTLGEIGKLEYDKILFEGAINGQSIPTGTFNGVSVPVDEDGDQYFTPGIDRDLNDKSTLSNPYKLQFNFKGEKISAYEGDKSIQLANSNMIATDAIYVDENGNPTSIYDSLFTTEDSNGNKTTFIRDGIKVKAKDDTFISLSSVINTISSTQHHIQSFFFGSIDFGKDLLSAVGSIFDNTRPQLFDQNKNPLFLDQDGNKTNQSYHYLTDEDGNQILDEEGNPIEVENKKATGPSNIELLLADFAARVATGTDIDEAALETAKTAMAREISKDLVAKIGLNDTQLQNGIAVAIARIGVMHLNGDDPNSQDYAIAAMEGILIAAGIPIAVVSGIIAATNKIIKEDGKFNSDGYQDVAAIAITTTIVVTVCIKVGAVVGSFFAPAVGTVIGAVVGAVVGYLIATPLYNALRDGWEDIEQIYDAFEDIFKGDDIDDQLKEALKGVEDLAKDFTIDFIKDVGRGAITLFTGRYGKELKDGQYWNPYPSLNIIPKADGSGNIIQGLDPQGIVAIAREYYHDDIYGTSGSDNLIGKSGTNTIYGYEGNDHIEGRGDIDLIIAGQGDDEIFAGNGDDQIYGSEGNDNLFGGNGNDKIIGGTGASISLEGSLEDGNDFIQGGNGDDQIMGEAGDDVIEGNNGNDKRHSYEVASILQLAQLKNKKTCNYILIGKSGILKNKKTCEYNLIAKSGANTILGFEVNNYTARNYYFANDNFLNSTNKAISIIIY